MKIKNIITIILLCAGTFAGMAETPKTTKAHNDAHKQLLAKAKSSRIDKTVIQDFLKQDIERREEAINPTNHLSAETSAMIDDLLKEASSHMGKRYRSGAKGPNAFDCSGFSSYVFRQFGYDLSSSSSAQYTQGEKIDKKELRKGDLVFFTGRNSRRGNVGHVGIVVYADNEKGTFTFIHASTSQGIRIDSSNGYYQHRYLGARRVITD